MLKVNKCNFLESNVIKSDYIMNYIMEVLEWKMRLGNELRGNKGNCLTKEFEHVR